MSSIDDPTPEDIAEAAKILEEGARSYTYRSDYKGGPRNLSPEIILEASIQMQAARQVKDELDARAEEGRLLFLETIEHLLQSGIPVDQIANDSGLKHRANVYREAREVLPKLRRKLRSAEEIRQQQTATRGQQ